MAIQSNAPICAAYTFSDTLCQQLFRKGAFVRRLYYVADDLETSQRISDELHSEGISDWNFHVLTKDIDGLYRHHIHSATPIHELDIVHTGERWAMVGALVCFVVALAIHLSGALPWSTSSVSVLLFTLVGGLFGAWQGGMVGLTRENYKIEPFHEDIEAGRYLVMVDVSNENKARVREIMNMQFPDVRFCGRDTTLINPFKRPQRIYHQTTH